METENRIKLTETLFAKRTYSKKSDPHQLGYLIGTLKALLIWGNIGREEAKGIIRSLISISDQDSSYWSQSIKEITETAAVKWGIEVKVVEENC